MYVGDAHKATAAKGQKLLNFRIEQLIKLIHAVKVDTLTPALVAEFNIRQTSPNIPGYWVEKA
jgi:hypothetical protein